MFAYNAISYRVGSCPDVRMSEGTKGLQPRDVSGRFDYAEYTGRLQVAIGQTKKLERQEICQG